MFNKSSLFNKRDEVPAQRNGLNPPPPPASGTTSTTPTSSISRPTPRPGTFGANMRSQFDSTPQNTDTTPSSSRDPKMSENTSTKDSGSRLIVGPDVKLRGAEILDCDTLVVEGRVEATMDSRVIRIAENGSFSGKVGIDVAEIHGHFDGDLTAREQLIIHATGRVSGTIRYGKILIEEGGELSGDVQSLASAKSGAAKDAPTDKVKPLVASSGS
ncbi:polymer-forming cytoskeletal protein [Nitrogeniibacter mangrovi]|uniref:Polymer-forming cytoskeletal protein n=1 Tax=Nitrogeniibacter mangrovi TaxID=2016596 RepID=A0A6C1B3M8_9RHOO|nr:polymer-forming cytoskeletal protein [Nitrogeniibacter mangrovi]QID17993.1 polymer-forming cytoskeletal protein [Nitrogeniibacter mangrovi]